MQSISRRVAKAVFAGTSQLLSSSGTSGASSCTEVSDGWKPCVYGVAVGC